jgi:hypothetical protein
MISQRRFVAVILVFLGLACASPLLAQQKGQYVPGQYGLNAGVIPDPGFTYANLTINYSAGQLNDSSGNRLPGITGTYSFWVNENLIFYVPKHKFLGATFFPYVVLAAANGSLVADLVNLPNLSANGGGEGFADMYVEPLNLGWHLKHADVAVGYGFTAPTGRFTPLASNNVGSGYWGNDFTTNTTVYLTKNKATTANLATIWEIHGQKDGINITPGQTFTDEWGFGQILPLKKDFSRLLQLGVIGYDQWQVTNNGGMTAGFPFYSSHAVGLQTNFILPAKDFSAFFKYENEFSAKARPEGRVFVFGFTWTLRIPKPEPPPTPPPAAPPAKK